MTRTSSPAEIEDTNTEVLIVGGGPAGLTASILLAQLGVSSIVVERRNGDSKLPKAHYLNSRTMEIFAQLGVADDIYAQGAPVDRLATVALYTTLGGSGRNDRRLVHVWDAFGGGALRDAYALTSSHPPGNLPQKHLEPLLRGHAERHNPGRVHFGHELVALAGTEDGGVDARIRGPLGSRRVRARYAIAADGGNTVGPLLGIPMHGAAPFVRMIGLHFAADLSPYLQEDTSLIRLVVRPNAEGVPVQTGMVGMGPHHWDRHCEQWQLNIVIPLGADMASAEWTDDEAVAQIRDTLNIVDLDVTMLRISEWDVEGVLSQSYRDGSVFLVGDAAHRHPPTTGLGLNSAVADVHNLVWKLAAVLHGHAGDDLLDSYESERRPVARRNIDWALFTFYNHLACQAGWGVLPGAPAEINTEAFHATLSDSADGRARLARLKEFLNTQRAEYQARDIELGYEYTDSASICPDDSDEPPRDPMGVNYIQHTRPGARMPHAWLTADVNERRSTHSLLRADGFLMLTGSQGDAWRAAAASVSADTGTTIDVHSIGVRGTDLIDDDAAWAALREHDDDGAIIVRPDGHVLYRSAGAVSDHTSAVTAAVTTGLGRRVIAAQPEASYAPAQR